MPTYAIEKNTDGAVVSVATWSADDATLPSGYTACTAAEYTTAKSALVNSLQSQALGALVTVQAQALQALAAGETSGPLTQAYTKSLQAIASGTDTTSTALPTAPAAYTD
ncbi:hypothetical protein CFR73_07645 [Novacetimonas maltaceti]|uniref:Uncharacterized protein n=1 Tax=Novacetimonas maltaceti TaxID=1203393 RepID=A0A2S3W4S7_9PROT|nr:hypothetical protein [Novacetimonas maltaceti]POF63861.1 hypothetical protein KMAL_03920 [Novacetimonas maltaceti]PYD60273.1 hypothetical protein CFR73_07645 [Novacetimonas maltaceti]BCZ75994.1 hypothetical protein [Komagataeibacter phage phiKM1]